MPKPESYWTQRNALVDAVKSASPSLSVIEIPHAKRTLGQQRDCERYGDALDALKDFDTANGGTPIL